MITDVCKNGDLNALLRRSPLGLCGGLCSSTVLPPFPIIFHQFHDVCSIFTCPSHCHSLPLPPSRLKQAPGMRM
ncbi:hypothetical protein DAI22_06g089600 [Oryza sativa Japonica Group]|nr:hypothetical protein DAI22_06g089600 [Oryza sativa Japonica Group]